MNQSLFGFWRRRQFFLLACGCLPALACLAEGGAQDPVTVAKKPVEVGEELFEPLEPPPAEQAHTACTYALGVGLRAEPQSQASADGKVFARIKITGIEAALTLKVVLALPRLAPKKLRDHERGHQKIGEYFYASADAAAKQLFQPHLGEVVTGTGDTLEAAQQDAIHKASDRLAQAYLAQINARSQRVQDIYDEITAHGTKAGIEEDAAIVMAVAQWREEAEKAQVPASR